MRLIEEAKTVLLVALVILSLVLTGRLMVGVQSAAQDTDQVFPLVDLEKPEVDLEAVLKPSRIAVHLGNGQHRVLLPGTPDYAALWDTGLVRQVILGEIGGLVQQDPVDMKALRAEQGSLEIIYPVKLQFSRMVAIWTGAPWTGGEDFLSDRVAVSTGKTPAVYVYSYAHDGYLRLDVKGLGNRASVLANLLKDFAAGDRPRWVEAPAEVNGITINRGVLLPKPDYSIPALVVKGEQTSPEEMLHKFFLDRSVVRTIEENDGAVIYSDGRQGLRVYPPGAVEYSCPVVAGDGQAGDYMAALERALEFTALHGGLPEGVHPIEMSGHSRTAGLQEIRLSYRWKGIPVWGDEAPIVVGLSSQGVGSYLRGVYVVAGSVNPSGQTVSAEEALNILSRHWATVFPEGLERAVKDVYPGYWSNPVGTEQDLLKPVWVVESSSGLKAFIDVASGAVWGEQKGGSLGWTGPKPR
ncbi:MAG: hypothetical protein ACM3X4_03365 [Ignavibacteriales bacterium]